MMNVIKKKKIYCLLNKVQKKKEIIKVWWRNLTLPVDWRLPARGERPLIITTSSHHHHTCSRAWPGVTAQLVPPSPQSHSLTRL